MADIYNYKGNTSVIATPKGDIVITMNKDIYVKLLNDIWDASKLQEKEGHKATSDDTMEFWESLHKL